MSVNFKYFVIGLNFLGFSIKSCESHLNMLPFGVDMNIWTDGIIYL